LQAAGELQEAGAGFHHHVILIEGGVHDGDLGLAKGIGKDGIDLRRVDPRREAVTRSMMRGGFQAVALLIDVTSASP